MTDSTPPQPDSSPSDVWPDLPLEAWQETYATLRLWTQVVGKIKLALAPMRNHWWQIAFHVTARGLTTSLIPYGERTFQIDFDFLDHELRIETGEGRNAILPLVPRSVADFYREVMARLRSLGIEVEIWTTPVEMDERIPFEQDTRHGAYDPEYAQRFWRILVQTQRVIDAFNSPFMGKISPVNFFWGSFDLSFSRFSGRTAPKHPGSPNVARYVMVEAYSREEATFGFWPGLGVGKPMFYAYAYPEPAGFAAAAVWPPAAYYDRDFKEFFLPYDAVKNAPSPDAALKAFLQSAYDAAADLGRWDRATLERAPS